MKKRALRCMRLSLLALLALTFVFSAASCTDTSAYENRISELESKLADSEDRIDELEDKLLESQNKVAELEAKAHQYDFYVTLGTMPTLYATLNAYAEKNPNTYMWFYRGNTISYEYSAPYISYFGTQSKTNANSTIDYSVIRDKVKDILAVDPDAKFHLYCDDLRVSFIPHIFVYAGVDFEDLEVTLLSDGTGTYHLFNSQTDEDYAGYAQQWEDMINTYKEGRDDPNFVAPYADDDQAVDLQELAYYVTTFENVELWVQSPEYLVCEAEKVQADREKMEIIGKNPKDMYNALDKNTRDEYQKVVLANALVDSETLTTLDEAVEYFNSKLSGKDKEIVLILGTNRPWLDENKFYIDETIKYYTPTLSETDPTKVKYKNKEYTVAEGAETVEADGRTLKIGEIGVYLYFKGHPAYPAKEDLQNYFDENGIEVLPHRTPVETLFWMYDVKAGGYQSTSFLSCSKGQTEFFYEEPATEAIVQMKDAGFFEGAAVFSAPSQDSN